MKFFYYFLFFCTFTLAASSHDSHKHHLVFETKGLHAHVYRPQHLTTGTIHEMSLEFRDAVTHELKTPSDTISVVLWMPSMGHGSAPTHIVQNKDIAGQIIAGSFIVKNLIFLMPGVWTLNVSLLSPQGESETQSVSIDIPNTGSHTHH